MAGPTAGRQRPATLDRGVPAGYAAALRSARRSTGRPGYDPPVPVVLGVDFGTESGRCLLVDLDDGSELADTEVRYPSGVIDEELPGTSGRPGTPLPPDWALQDPRDYLHVLAV